MEHTTILNNTSLYSNLSLWTSMHYYAFTNRHKLPNLFFYYFPSNVHDKNITCSPSLFEKLKELVTTHSEGLYGYYGLYFGISGSTLYSIANNNNEFPIEKLIKDASAPSSIYEELITKYFSENEEFLKSIEAEINLNECRVPCNEGKQFKARRTFESKGIKKIKANGKRNSVEDSVITLKTPSKQLSITAFMSNGGSEELLKLKNFAYINKGKDPMVFIKKLLHLNRVEAFFEHLITKLGLIKDITREIENTYLSTSNEQIKNLKNEYSDCISYISSNISIGKKIVDRINILLSIIKILNDKDIKVVIKILKDTDSLSLVYLYKQLSQTDKSAGRLLYCLIHGIYSLYEKVCNHTLIKEIECTIEGQIIFLISEVLCTLHSTEYVIRMSLILEKLIKIAKIYEIKIIEYDIISILIKILFEPKDQFHNYFKKLAKSNIKLQELHTISSYYIKIIFSFYDIEDTVEVYEELLSLLDKMYEYKQDKLIIVQSHLILSAVFPLKEKFTLNNTELFIKNIESALDCISSNLSLHHCLIRSIKLFVHYFEISSMDFHRVVVVVFNWMIGARTADSKVLYRKEVLVPGHNFIENECYSTELICCIKEYLNKHKESKEVATVKKSIAKLNMMINIRASRNLGENRVIEVDNAIEELLFYLKVFEVIACTYYDFQVPDVILKRILNEFGEYLPLIECSIILYALKIIKSSLNNIQNLSEILQLTIQRVVKLHYSLNNFELTYLLLYPLSSFALNLPKRFITCRQHFFHNFIKDLLAIQSKAPINLKMSCIHLLSSGIPTDEKPGEDNELDEYLLAIDLNEEIERQGQIEVFKIELAKILNNDWKCFLETLIDFQHYPLTVHIEFQLYIECNAVLGKLIGFLLRSGIMKWPIAISHYTSDKSTLWNPNNKKYFSYGQIVLGQIKFLHYLFTTAGKSLGECEGQVLDLFANKLIVYLTRALLLPSNDPSFIALHCFAAPFIRSLRKKTFASRFFDIDPKTSESRLTAWYDVFQHFIVETKELNSDMIQYLRNLHLFITKHTNTTQTTEWIQWIQGLIIMSIKCILQANGIEVLLNDYIELILTIIPKKKRVIEIQRYYGLLDAFSLLADKIKSYEKYLKRILLSLIESCEVTELIEEIMKKVIMQYKDWKTRDKGINLLMVLGRYLPKTTKLVLTQKNCKVLLMQDNELQLTFLKQIVKERAVPVILKMTLKKAISKKVKYFKQFCHSKCDIRILSSMLQYLMVYLSLDSSQVEEYVSILKHFHEHLLYLIQKYIMNSINYMQNFCAICGVNTDVLINLGETPKDKDINEAIKNYYKFIRKLYKRMEDVSIRKEINVLLRIETKVMVKIRSKPESKVLVDEIYKAIRKIDSLVYSYTQHELLSADW